MSFELSAVNPIRPAVDPPGTASRVASRGAAPPTATPGATVDALPASPPPEVRAEMLAAQRAAQDLYERGRELHFEMTGGRLRIELRDLDGNVLKTIPPSAALEIAGGKAVE